jgi:hypothetical protein
MPSRKTEEKSIWVQIKLVGEDFAQPYEPGLRRILEHAVEKQGIGVLEGHGSGGDWMDFSFGVENLEAALRALAFVKNILTQRHVSDELVRLELYDKDEEVCDNLPEFRVGDCLSYRFEDGDFGAAIVLSTDISSLSQSMQSGMPVSSDETETLLGLLDYKSQTPPEANDFEKQNWLIGTHESWKCQPFRIWLHCFGGIDIQHVYHVSLKIDETIDCRFHLSWDLLAEYFIREKYRDNPELNLYESGRDIKSLNAPKYIAGDCISYRFADGDFGAAIVLKNSDDDYYANGMLLGILDYKDLVPPSLTVFESRKWLLHKNQWANGQPFLVWAQYCWSNDCKGIDAKLVEHISLEEDEPKFTQLCLFWEGIPEFVLLETGK